MNPIMFLRNDDELTHSLKKYRKEVSICDFQERDIGTWH